MNAGQGRPRSLDALHVAALCAGVMLQVVAPALLPVAGAVAALMVAGLLLVVGGRQAMPEVLAAVLLGVGGCALHGHATRAAHLPPAFDGERVVLDARVRGLPQADPRGSRFAVEVERVMAGAPGIAETLEGRRLDLRWFGGGRALRPGERWRWSVRLASLRGPMNPGDADPLRRALVDGTVAVGHVQASARPLRLDAGGGLHALRDAVSRRIIDALGTERARFVAALAVGDTRDLSDGDWERLRRFGLTHLIAISGFHVGMVAGLGVLAVRGLWWLRPSLAHRWRRLQAAAVGATAVALAYAALAGFSLPTVRTVLMVAAVAAVVALRRRTRPAQALLLAVVVIVLADPFALLTPGFWLSCGGVAWLMWCLPNVDSPFDLRAFLAAQWVATLGLLPIAAAFFLQVPLAGPLANLVAIPWISLVVVPLSLLGTLVAAVSDGAAAPVWWLASEAMALLWQGLERVPEAASTVRWLPTPSIIAVVLALLGVAIALLPRGLPGRHAGWLLLLPLLAPRLPGPAHGEVAVTVFSLPRGDALLLSTHRAHVLVDAGPVHADLPRTLRAMGITALDLRIETRANAGRKGGVDAVDAAFPPRSVWRAGTVAEGVRCEAGRRWSKDGVRLHATSPPGGAGGNEPHHACVLRVDDAHGNRLWLVSEAGRWVAQRLATRPRTTAGATWVIGAPASLDAWRSAFDADGAIATRAPGPSLSRRWPEDAHRVDHAGALVWTTTAGVRALQADASARRWWHPAPRAASP